MKKQVITIIAISVGGLALIGLIISLLFRGLEKEVKAIAHDYIPSTYSLIHDDSVVISPKYLDKIRVREITHSKNRNPVSLLKFDTTYDLVIYRIDLKKQAPLPKIFTSKIKDEGISTGFEYDVTSSNLHTMYFDNQVIRPVSVLYVTFFGGAVAEIANSDSILCYNFQCQNLSIRYARTAPVDILFKGTGDSFNPTPFPLDVLFLEKNNAVYLAALSPIKAGAPLDKNLLFNIVTGN